MSVTQTVEVPDSHRLTIDIPRKIPAGPVVLTFTPKAAETSPGIKTQKAMAGLDLGSSPPYDPVKAMEAIKRCSGLAKRLGINLSVDEFLKMRRQGQRD